jgi:hypothetical protein
MDQCVVQYCTISSERALHAPYIVLYINEYLYVTSYRACLLAASFQLTVDRGDVSSLLAAVVEKILSHAAVRRPHQPLW